MASLMKLSIACCCFVLLVSVQPTDAVRSRNKWSFGKPAAIAPTVLGTVFCDQCLDKSFTFNTIAIANVTVTLDCGEFQASNTTSDTGIFTIQIPSQVAASPSKLAACTAKVASDFSQVQGDVATCNSPVQLQHPFGSPPPSTLSAAQNGWPFYTVGPFFFQPPQPLPACKPMANFYNPYYPSPPHKLNGAAAPPFPSPPHPKLDTSAASPPQQNFPGYGFPPFFPGTYPPHPQPAAGAHNSKTSNKGVAPPPQHSYGFGFPPFPFFPGSIPPYPAPVAHGSGKTSSPPPPPFGQARHPRQGGYKFPPAFPGAFPPPSSPKTRGHRKVSPPLPPFY